MSIFKKISTAWRLAQEHRQMPLHVEFYLTDGCNLNCKGCTHFSPVAPMEFEPIETLAQSMRHLGKTCGEQLPAVYLIGGEPLLYPQLAQACALARECFPHAEISLFTNGLLIPRLNDEVWKSLHDNNILISITRYPIAFDYDQAAQICLQHEVAVNEFADRGEANEYFRFPLDQSKSQNAWISHFRCFQYGCLGIHSGKIFPCSTSACAHRLNAAFGTDFKHELGDYMLVSEVKSVADLLRFRQRTVPFCGYCKRYELSDYGPSKREKSEWID